MSNKIAEAPSNNDFILHIGTLQSVKNSKLFVELTKKIPKIKFVMIGRNLDAFHLDKEYKVLILAKLILLNEIKHEDATDATIFACKLFVMTSKREGIPTVLLEAMAMAKPVVVPNHSGCKEVVCNDENGFLYDLDSFDDLLSKTRQATSPNNKGKGARERILKEYDWNIIVKKIDSIYEYSK